MNCVFPYENLNNQSKKTQNKSVILKKLRSMDFFKIGMLSTTLIASLLTYIITVNISSTQGYYYDQVRKAQEKSNFNYNIVKLDTLTLQSDLRNVINFNSAVKKDSIQYLEIR